MILSFTAFLILLGTSYASAAEVLQFDTKMEIIGCFHKKGCTNVDVKKITHKVNMKKLKNNKGSFGSVVVKTKGHGELFSATVDILKSRVKENWIYTFTAYFKNSATTPTVVKTRNINDVNVLVLKSKMRKKGIKKPKSVVSTFYFGPVGSTIF